MTVRESSQGLYDSQFGCGDHLSDGLVKIYSMVSAHDRRVTQEIRCVTQVMMDATNPIGGLPHKPQER